MVQDVTMNMLRLLLCFLISLLSFSLKGQASPPPLERKITLNIQQAPIDEILNKLSAQGKFTFSYSTKYVEVDQKITISITNKSVRYALDRIFKGTVHYKSKGNYIILTAAPKKPDITTSSPKYTLVSGYIFEKETSTQLSQVSIFDEQSLNASITDNFGYFSLRIPNNSTRIKLNVQKNGYIDTTVIVEKTYFEAVEVVLRKKTNQPKPTYIPHVRDSSVKTIDSSKLSLAEPKKLSRLKEMSFLLTQKMKNSLNNLTDTLFKHAQFSLVPGISTNGLVGTNIINKYSFNLLAGYSYGVKYAEIGGLVNAHRGNVSYFEVAGLANVVGGHVNGFQAAGLFNIGKQNVKGMQAAGLFNTSFKLNGVQASGLFNSTQIADGAQIGGLFNYAKHLEGLQIGGLFNYAKRIKGAQISGLVNITGNLRKGVMISLINIADTCQGIPIGLFSWVKHGYHKLEISSDELFYTNISFRTGVSKFHTIFSAGIDPKALAHTNWTYGFGIGTTFKIGKKTNLDMDLGTHQLHRTNQPIVSDSLTPNTPSTNSLNLNNKLYVGLEWQLSEKIGLALGPTFNIHLMDKSHLAYFDTSSIRPAYLYDKEFNTNYQCRMWVGGKLALRFF